MSALLLALLLHADDGMSRARELVAAELDNMRPRPVWRITGLPRPFAQGTTWQGTSVPSVESRKPLNQGGFRTVRMLTPTAGFGGGIVNCPT